MRRFLVPRLTARRVADQRIEVEAQRIKQLDRDAIKTWLERFAILSATIGLVFGVGAYFEAVKQNQIATRAFEEQSYLAATELLYNERASIAARFRGLSNLVSRGESLSGISIKCAAKSDFSCRVEPTLTATADGAVVDYCNFTNLKLVGGSLRNLLFDQCQMAGVEFLNNVALEEVYFRRSTLQLDVSGADLSSVEFWLTDISRSRFFSTAEDTPPSFYMTNISSVDFCYHGMRRGDGQCIPPTEDALKYTWYENGRPPIGRNRDVIPLANHCMVYRSPWAVLCTGPLFDDYDYASVTDWKQT